MKNTRVTFLHAAIPLAKEFTLLPNKEIDASKSYPLVTNVTSTEVNIKSLRNLYDALTTYATSKEKHCLLKGELIRPLENESRKAMCQQDTLTHLIVLDLDKAPFSSAAEFMKSMDLDDMSYIWQWSSSAKLYKTKTLSGHIFMLTDKPIHPRTIKAWLMNKNMNTDVLRRAVTLSNSKNALHWPLDIIVNDNGRIIYIAEPTFINMKSPIPPNERIQYVQGEKEFFHTADIPELAIEALKVQQRDIINALRVDQKLPINKVKIKQVGEFEVQGGVGEATSYEVIDTGMDYIRYNLNGGNSQAYWHPRNSFEMLHNFKGEPSMYMKEILPARYKELIEQNKTQNVNPNTAGNIIIAFRDKHTSRYWKGFWNEAEYNLDVQSVGDSLVLDHFVKQFGAPLGDFIPEWRVTFDPTDDTVYDAKNCVLNTFVATPYMRGVYDRPVSAKGFPTIQKIIDHAVGVGEVQEHFLNWLAVILQYRRKTRVSWILHGTEGTGKGLLVNNILGPIFEDYVTSQKASILKQDFNGWMENALVAFIDEIEADVFDKRSMEGDLRHAITEPSIQIRKMRTDVYKARSFINFIFSSNKPQPVRLPTGDRRFNVGKFQPVRLVPTGREIDVDIPAELPAFCQYLLTREADVDLAGTILQTEDRETMQALSVTSVDEFAGNIIKGKLANLWEYMPDEKLLLQHGVLSPAAAAYIHLMKRFINEPTSTISRDELQMMFTHAIGKVPEGANKFTTYLRHHNIITKKIRADGIATYGISITWDMTAEDRIGFINSLRGDKQVVQTQPATKLKAVRKNGTT